MIDFAQDIYVVLNDFILDHFLVVGLFCKNLGFGERKGQDDALWQFL